MKTIRFASLPSSNTFLRENYQKLDHFTVVRVDHQTKGRGRQNRIWYDDDDLLFSVLLKNDISDDPSVYCFLAAAAMIKALKKYHPLVKWPNDIFINKQKVAGILSEAVTCGKTECVIIGIGLNVNTESFPSDVKGATSLRKECGIFFSTSEKERLFGKIIRSLAIEIEYYQRGSKRYLKVIRKNLYLNGKKIVYDDNGLLRRGTVIGISESGKLLIEEEIEVKTESKSL